MALKDFWLEIESWHFVRGADQGINPWIATTLCGLERMTEKLQTRATMPPQEKSCENCLRLLQEERDRPKTRAGR